MRSCGECVLCCRLVGVQALGKDSGVWCQHCKVGKGCTIYEERPQECRDFYCAWAFNEAIPEDLRPDHAKIILSAANDDLFIFVDANNENSWRQHGRMGRLIEQNIPRIKGEVKIVAGTKIMKLTHFMGVAEKSNA